MNKEYNDIGISSQLDYKSIRKLLFIGLFAACLTFVGDWILGYGLSDKSLSGIELMLSKYIDRTDSQLFWSSFLGLIGVNLEALCYFGIYRLIASGSSKLAHWYRSGIFGYLAFGGCGVHVFCLAAVYFYKYMLIANPNQALEVLMRFGLYFMLPNFALFAIFFYILIFSQLLAFLKGKTPYPKWCVIFNVIFPMVVCLLLGLLPETKVINAIISGWISIGNIWMFAGLLVTMKYEKGYENIRRED